MGGILRAAVVFQTKPDAHVDEYVLVLRYSQRIWRDWFYYEIKPQLSWEEEFDYQLVRASICGSRYFTEPIKTRASGGVTMRIRTNFAGNQASL